MKNKLTKVLNWLCLATIVFVNIDGLLKFLGVYEGGQFGIYNSTHFLWLIKFGLLLLIGVASVILYYTDDNPQILKNLVIILCCQPDIPIIGLLILLALWRVGFFKLNKWPLLKETKI
ncbi:MAG: hypothetical protein WCF94_00550 [bacterium]